MVLILASFVHVIYFGEVVVVDAQANYSDIESAFWCIIQGDHIIGGVNYFPDGAGFSEVDAVEDDEDGINKRILVDRIVEADNNFYAITPLALGNHEGWPPQAQKQAKNKTAFHARVLEVLTSWSDLKGHIAF